MAIETNSYRRNDAVKRPVMSYTASKPTNDNTDSDGSYNPRPYAGKTTDGRNISASKGRIFDNKGRLNAYSNQDAMQQIAHLFQTAMAQDAPVRTASVKKESALSKEAKQRAIIAAFKDPSKEGFHMIGSELVEPIKEVIDYEGWARKCMRIRNLGQAELFRLTKDVVDQVTAWTIGQDGQTPVSSVKGTYFNAELMEITSFVNVAITEIYNMQFDGLDRARDLARQDIERKEDRAFIAGLNAAATSNDITYFTDLGVAAFEDIRFQVEKNRLQVDKFLINRAELSDMVKTMRGEIDPASQRELLLSGYVGNILNCQIITSAGTNSVPGLSMEVVPAGKVYAIPAPEFLGDFGVQIELFSEPYDNYAVHQAKKGWLLLEKVGFLFPNSKGIAIGSK